MLKTLKTVCDSWLGFGLLLIILVIGLRSLQTYWGKQAFVATQLPQHSLQMAQQLARQQGRNIVAELSAFWCSSCRALDEQVLQNSQVRQLLQQQFIYARIDEKSADAEQFTRDYGAQGYPSLVLLDAQGRLLKHLSLTLDPQQFMAQLTASNPPLNPATQ